MSFGTSSFVTEEAKDLGGSDILKVYRSKNNNEREGVKLILFMTVSQKTLKLKMDKDAAEVLVVLLEPVIQRLDVLLFQEADDAFLELAATLAGNDLHERDPLVHSLAHDAVELAVDSAAFIEDIVQVELDLCHWGCSGVAGLFYGVRAW